MYFKKTTIIITALLFLTFLSACSNQTSEINKKLHSNENKISRVKTLAIDSIAKITFSSNLVEGDWREVQLENESISKLITAFNNIDEKEVTYLKMPYVEWGGDDPTKRVGALLIYFKNGNKTWIHFDSKVDKIYILQTKPVKNQLDVELPYTVPLTVKFKELFNKQFGKPSQNQFEKLFPKNYGGVFLEGGTITVNLTVGAPNTNVLLDKGIKINYVDYTYQELLTLQKELTAHMKKLEIINVGIDEKGNKVKAEVPSSAIKEKVLSDFKQPFLEVNVYENMEITN